MWWQSGHRQICNTRNTIHTHYAAFTFTSDRWYNKQKHQSFLKWWLKSFFILASKFLQLFPHCLWNIAISAQEPLWYLQLWLCSSPWSKKIGDSGWYHKWIPTLKKQICDAVKPFRVFPPKKQTIFTTKTHTKSLYLNHKNGWLYFPYDYVKMTRTTRSVWEHYGLDSIGTVVILFFFFFFFF